MRLHSREFSHGCEIKIAPLIDVVFLLIIFFMVVSQFTQMEAETLQLPQAAHGEEPTQSIPRRIIVNVLVDGDIVINGLAHSSSAFDELLSAQSSSQAQRPTVIIRADRKTPARHIRAILVACARHGITGVNLSVVPLNSEE